MVPRPSAFLSLVLALLFLTDVCGAKTAHKVGGVDAWGLPPASKPDVYLRWTSSVRPRLGDSLLFLYPPGRGDAVQVTARAIANCNVSAPLLKLNDGNSVFNLTAPGRAYYTSSVPGHCRRGQRLSLDVPTANGTYLPPSADDLAALAVLAKVPPAAPPTEALPALASADDDESGAAPRADADRAGSVVIAAAAALSFGLLV